MKVTLTITVNDEGKCVVDGPLHNKIVCYGLLEEAKHVIREFDPKKQNVIHTVPAGSVPRTGA